MANRPWLDLRGRGAAIFALISLLGFALMWGVTMALQESPGDEHEVAGPGIQRLTQAEVLEAGQAYPQEPPSRATAGPQDTGTTAAQELTPGADWAARTLPDNWGSTRVGQGGYVWYRLRFDGVAPDQDTALYLPGFSMNVAVWVNGVALGGVGRMREPVSRYLYTPRLMAVPTTLLNPGPQANELLVLVVGYPMLRSGLSELYIGPVASLRAAHDWRYFWQHTGLVISIVVAVMLGLYVLMLWWRERSNEVFGWFGLAALIWGLRNLNLILTELPGHAALPNLVWSRLFASGEIFFIAAFAMFTLRYTESIQQRSTDGQSVDRPFARQRWPAVVAATYVLVGPAVMLSVPADIVSWRAINAMMVWALAMTVWTQARLSLAAWQVRRAEPVAIALAGFLYVLLLAHDVALVADTQQQALYHLRPYAVLPLFAAVGWLLTRRYLDALEAAQQMSASLQKQVEAQRQELARNFARLREVERETDREQTQAEERGRLMRDLHDGLGLHLLSALQQARAPSNDTGLLASTLQDCLDDLRMTVDSLAGDERDPAAVLGNLRYRMAPRLAAAGIRLDWAVGPDVPELPWLDPTHVLQLLRVVQEALTNAVKHSGASIVTIALRQASGQLEVSVQDNGRGTAELARPGGRGLANMQARTASMGGSLVLQSDASGTCVLIRLPLVRAD